MHQKGNVLIKQFRVDLSIHNTQNIIARYRDKEKSLYDYKRSFCLLFMHAPNHDGAKNIAMYVWRLTQIFYVIQNGEKTTTKQRDTTIHNFIIDQMELSQPKYTWRSRGLIICHAQYKVPNAQLRMRDSRIKSLVRRL